MPLKYSNKAQCFCLTKDPITRQKIFGTARMEQVRVRQKRWLGTGKVCRVNDFALSVPSQNFTLARPSTDKIGTRSWNSSPGPVKC